MKVILLCDVKGTGKKDDVLNVSDGFARNYLFPRKWAVEATPGAVKEIERKRANEERPDTLRLPLPSLPSGSLLHVPHRADLFWKVQTLPVQVDWICKKMFLQMGSAHLLL